MITQFQENAFRKVAAMVNIMAKANGEPQPVDIAHAIMELHALGNDEPADVTINLEISGVPVGVPVNLVIPPYPPKMEE